MMYGSSDMECTRQNFLSFWIVFSPFIPLTEFLSFWTILLKKTPGDIIIFHMCTINDNHMIMVPEISSATEFFVILGYFLPFYPLNNPKNQNIEKIKNTPTDIIILHKCTTNENQMIYGSSDMKRDRQNFLSFWTIFPLLLPYGPRKLKKTTGDIIILHKCIKNHDHRLYCS